jgi:hypothetical protein
MEILVEGSTPASAATRPNLDQWITQVPEPFTTVLDSVPPQPGMETFFGTPRDQFIIVDLRTMKFIDIWDADPQSAINEVEGLLSPTADGGMPDG